MYSVYIAHAVRDFFFSIFIVMIMASKICSDYLAFMLWVMIFGNEMNWILVYM